MTIEQLKDLMNRLEAKAEAYQDAANFIERIVIETSNSIIQDYKASYDKEFMKYNVDDYLKQNKLIHAIKRRRIDTNEGLKEAKDYCEKRREELKNNA